MANNVWLLNGCPHTFKSKQEALDYASFDQWIDSMRGDPPRIVILSKMTTKQYKTFLARRAKQNSEVIHPEIDPQ